VSHCTKQELSLQIKNDSFINYQIEIYNNDPEGKLIYVGVDGEGIWKVSTNKDKNYITTSITLEKFTQNQLEQMKSFLDSQIKKYLL
jgi:hypothetical protein